MNLHVAGFACEGWPEDSVGEEFRARLPGRPAPARQVDRVLALGQAQPLLDRDLEIGLDRFSRHPAAQKIGQRNSLNGVVSLAKPPTRRNSPARLRNGSSLRSATDLAMSLK